MQLCLVNNDPISTLLITPDGEPLFSIETPSLPPEPAARPQFPFPPTLSPPADSGLKDVASTTVLEPTSFVSLAPRQRSPKTTIKRIDKHHRSMGQVETEIGTVEYRGPEMGTHLQLCAHDHALAISESRKGLSAKAIVENEGSQCVDEQLVLEDKDQTCWEFVGPDTRRYKWQIFVHSPVLLTADSTLTPLARYRRAKIGIVSRSRRAFLEILPAGINIIDLIVVTFVGFMKQRVLVEGAVYETPESSPTPSVLPSRSSGLITPTPS